MSSVLRIDIRTKIARGPNPLSNKRKKVVKVKDGGEEKVKRKRIRKRNRDRGQVGVVEVVGNE